MSYISYDIPSCDQSNTFGNTASPLVTCTMLEQSLTKSTCPTTVNFSLRPFEVIYSFKVMFLHDFDQCYPDMKQITDDLDHEREML